eukprot:4942483-Amphidinium_carterae.1
MRPDVAGGTYFFNSQPRQIQEKGQDKWTTSRRCSKVKLCQALASRVCSTIASRNTTQAYRKAFGIDT